MNTRFISIVVTASMVAAAPALASPAAQAKGAVAATPQGPKPPEHFKPKTNINSQGALHANPRAILKVCSKTTPAAQRSALCPIVPPQ